jgi:hypothetical protein
VNNDDWFTHTPQSQDDEAPKSEPASTLSVVPSAPSHDEDDDWFTATGPVGSAAEPQIQPMSDGEQASTSDGAEWASDSQPLDESVDDDEDAGWIGASAPTVPILAVGTPTAAPAGKPSPSWLRRHRAGAAVAGSAIVLLAGGGLAMNALAGTASTAESTPITDLVTASPTTTTEEPEPVAAQPWCAGRADGTPIAVDSPDLGQATIARFQAAYYLDRDGHRARTFVAPDARVASADSINAGIATHIPAGTEHCVLAKKISDGVYAVDLFERRPDTTGEHYRQTITTTPDGALITAITPREGA